MKITAIKQQVKRADRYSIFVDGKYTCSFSEATLLKLGLRLHQEINPKELKKLKDSAQTDKAKTKAFDMIALRPRSTWELEDYLKRKGFEPETIDQTLETVRSLGYLDDLDFARRWVADRRLLKATSKRRLKQELRQKRVADDIIDKVLQDDETDERQVLKELIDRKRKQTRYQDNQKLMQYLIRQGFDYGTIKEALAEEQA